MPRYKYNAVSHIGEQITGEYASPDRDGVVAMLRQSGYFPTNITQMGETRSSRRKVPIKPLAAFCVQMAAMLKAGVSIAKTLDIMRFQTDDRSLREVLEDINVSVQRGNSLSEALQPHRRKFPDLFMNMIEAGEASGTLDVCMSRASVAFTRTARLNNKVRNAMIYPSIILVVLVILLFAMLVFVIPTFAAMYQDAGADLPAFTQFLLNAGEFMQRFWFIPLGVIVLFVLGFNMWLGTDKGRTTFDGFKLKIPMISKLLVKIYAARFSRTLSSLTAAGISLPQALTVTARAVINRVMEKEIYKVVEALNRGADLSSQLERMGMLPPMIVYMVKLGEESGTMDDLLQQAADFYDEESDSAIQAMTAIMEPALIILMAIIVAPVLIGVLYPMFGMYELMM